MNPILLFIIAVLIWLHLQLGIDTQNPCHALSNRPGYCTSGVEQ